jgi:hypothetical protein
MTLTWDEIQANAIASAKRWQGDGKEKQEAQSFVRAFLGVFGVDSTVIDHGFEASVKEKHKLNRRQLCNIRLSDYGVAVSFGIILDEQNPKKSPSIRPKTEMSVYYA